MGTLGLVKLKEIVEFDSFSLRNVRNPRTSQYINTSHIISAYFS